MILTHSEIQDIILKNPNKALVQQGQKYNKTMRLHMYGIGLEDHLTEIKGFESPAIKALRIKYSRSNKDVFARLKRPTDKAFSARGGSIYCNLSDSQNKQALALSYKLKGGVSLKKWMETVWLPHYLDDPHGLIFVEIDKDGNVYPTYKASTSIYDYELSGTSLEYVVFDLKAKDKVKYGLADTVQAYRVVDDSFDTIFKLENGVVTEVVSQTIENYFGYVPAQLNSDIPNSAGEGFISFFDEALTLADDYLLTGSIRTTHKFLHGFPKYYEYADSCNECEGTGNKAGEKCKECKGTGKNVMTKVSDVKLLSYPQTKDEPIITPNVAGYVEPSEIYHKISTDEMATLEDAMNFTIWGKSNQQFTPQATVEGKTATQILTEVKPEESRLEPISEAGEKGHKFILDAIIDFNIRPGYSLNGGCSVNYGRRYMLEGADSLWALYSDSRVKGAAVSILDDLLMNYLETEYSGDPVSMAIQVKLMRLEPFVHLTPSQVVAFQNVTNEDKAAKVYFSEWLSENEINNYLLITPIDVLRQQLIAYAVAKSKTVVAQMPKPSPTFN